MSSETDGSDEQRHERKGRIKRFLGWMTGDRRVEAEGVAEEHLGTSPSEDEAERTEHLIKKHEYGETADAPAPRNRPGNAAR